MKGVLLVNLGSPDVQTQKMSNAIWVNFNG